jgi:hypothetical protein
MQLIESVLGTVVRDLDQLIEETFPEVKDENE